MKKKKIIVILLIILFMFCVVPKSVQNDVFYSIIIGRDILGGASITGTDIYSWHGNITYTSPHWLFDVICYLVYSVGEFTSLHIFVCTIAAIVMILFYYILRKKNVNWLIAFVRNIDSWIFIKGLFYTEELKLFHI